MSNKVNLELPTELINMLYEMLRSARKDQDRVIRNILQETDSEYKLPIGNRVEFLEKIDYVINQLEDIRELGD
jgi:flagellin-specific chaperone FliS